MPARTRSPRVVVPGARIQFASTVAELLNVSPTGALIRMHSELRKGGEWPLVLDLPRTGQLWLHGRVVRCRRHHGAFVLALSFVSLNPETQAALNDICGTSEHGARAKEQRPRPLPWQLPTLSFERILRVHFSPERQCPECHSGDVSKQRSRSYSCLRCGCRFSGYRIGKIRISL